MAYRPTFGLTAGYIHWPHSQGHIVAASEHCVCSAPFLREKARFPAFFVLLCTISPSQVTCVHNGRVRGGLPAALPLALPWPFLQSPDKGNGADPGKFRRIAEKR